MRLLIRKSLVTALFLTIFIGALPANGWTAIAVQSEVISGTIVHVDANNALRLDNGQTYHPSRDDLAPEVQAGQLVTLRYYIEGDEKNVFFEFALGANALNQTGPASSKKVTGPK